MARRTAAEAEATRQKILMAANDVFWQEGVGNAALETVARAAGVTRGAVYWHFKDKDALLRALFDELPIPLQQAIPPRLDLAQSWAWLAGALHKTVHSEVSRQLSGIMLLQGTATRSAVIQEGLARLRGHFMGQIQALLAHAVASGQLPATLDLEAAEALLQSAVSGLLYECLQNPGERSSLIHSVFDSLLFLLKAPPGHLLRQQA